MRNPEDLARELTKIADVIDMADNHFEHEAHMNAALHMSPLTRPAPLAVAVHNARVDLHRLIEEIANGEPDPV